jgi:hypothetical protein
MVLVLQGASYNKGDTSPIGLIIPTEGYDKEQCEGGL